MTLRLTSPQAASVSSSAALMRLHRALQVRLDDAVELERLPRRQAQRVVGVGAGDGVERQPLLGRRDAARQAHADHEAVGLLELLLGALAARTSRSSCR